MSDTVRDSYSTWLRLSLLRVILLCSISWGQIYSMLVEEINGGYSNGKSAQIELFVNNEIWSLSCIYNLIFHSSYFHSLPYQPEALSWYIYLTNWCDFQVKHLVKLLEPQAILHQRSWTGIMDLKQTFGVPALFCISY